MNNRRYRLTSVHAGSVHEVIFDNTKYVLEDIDLGTAQEEAEVLDYKVGSKHLYSRLGSRNIDIECSVCNFQTTGYDYGSFSNVDYYKRWLQLVCSPFTEIVLHIDDRKSDGNWYEFCTIKTRLSSTIEWGHDSDNNNAFLCKAVIHLVADNPYFTTTLYERENSPGTYFFYVPYAYDITSTQDFSITTVSSYSSSIGVRNSGVNPYEYLKGYLKPRVSGNIWKIFIYSSKYASKKIIYDFGRAIPVTPTTSIYFDFDSMILTMDSVKYYPAADSTGINLDIYDTDTITFYCPVDPALSSYTLCDIVPTSGVGYLEV